MFPYNTGRGIKWFCWDCYKNSRREAMLSDVYRQKRLHKMANAKKRNK